MRYRSGLLVGVIALAGLRALPVPASAIPASETFAYTGSEQTYVVPPGVVTVGLAAERGHGERAGGEFGEGGGREGGAGALFVAGPGERLFAEIDKRRRV